MPPKQLLEPCENHAGGLVSTVTTLYPESLEISLDHPRFAYYNPDKEMVNEVRGLVADRLDPNLALGMEPGSNLGMRKRQQVDLESFFSQQWIHLLSRFQQRHLVSDYIHFHIQRMSLESYSFSFARDLQRFVF